MDSRLFVVVFAVLFVPSTVSECEFPSQLIGQWKNNLPTWSDYVLTITNDTISSLPTQGSTMKFTCFSKNGTTYLIESEQVPVGGSFVYNYYTCLDIAPSSSDTIVFFHVRTEPNSQYNDNPILSKVQGHDEKSVATICQTNSTEIPINYNIFTKQGFEDHIGNDSCPRSLQAEFFVNFTQQLDNSKCPDGFVLNGCDRSHLTFNFTSCNGSQDSLGSVNYSCLISMEEGNVTFTTIFTTTTVQGQANAYEFSCLEQTTMGAHLAITKSAGTCGGTPSTVLMANETLSCRAPTTLAPQLTTATEAGRNDTNVTTQAPATSTQGSGTGDGGQGEGGDGAGDSRPAAQISFLATLLLPAVACVLAIARP